MSERFVIADTHFGHRGMIQFVRADGTPLRPEWGRADPERLMSPEEAAERVAAMDEALIERWNTVIGPKDKVEVLGDVIIGRSQRATLGRLNGRKRLRMGNHDIFTRRWNEDYRPYFEEITAYKVMDDLIMSHIPLHPESVKERWLANVHGHLHSNRVMKRNPAFELWARTSRRGDPVPPIEIIDPRYLCVSVEHTGFRPISMDEVYERITRQREEADQIVQKSSLMR